MKGKRIIALIMAALFMLSVIGAGPAAATAKKYDPPKKDPKVCLKWTKIVKFDKKKTLKKSHFFWIKKHKAFKYLKFKKADWNLKDGKYYKFTILKKVKNKKDCKAKNPKKGKKIFFPPKFPPDNGEPPNGDDLEIEECLVHFTASRGQETAPNYINILPNANVESHTEQHTDTDNNRLGTDYDLAGVLEGDVPNPDAADELLEYLEEEYGPVVTCEEIDAAVDEGPVDERDETLIELLVEAGDELDDNVGVFPCLTDASTVRAPQCPAPA